MESVTDAAKDVVIAQLNPAFGGVTVELSILTLMHLCHSPAAAVDVIDFQETYFFTPAISAVLPAEYIHRALAHPPVLLSPLTPLFLDVVIAALPPPLTVRSHVFPHVLAVSLTTFLRRPITIVFLCHAVRVVPNTVNRPG